MKFLTQYKPSGLVYTRQTRTIIFDNLAHTVTCKEVTHTIDLSIPNLIKLGQSLKAKVKLTLSQVDKFFSWLLLGSDNAWASAAIA